MDFSIGVSLCNGNIFVGSTAVKRRQWPLSGMGSSTSPCTRFWWNPIYSPRQSSNACSPFRARASPPKRTPCIWKDKVKGNRCFYYQKVSLCSNYVLWCCEFFCYLYPNSLLVLYQVRASSAPALVSAASSSILLLLLLALMPTWKGGGKDRLSTWKTILFYEIIPSVLLLHLMTSI